MEDELILVKPNIELKEQAINLIEEVEKFDIDEKVRYSGFSRLQEYKDNYEEWLERIDKYTKKEMIPEGRVPANVFFSIRKSDNKLVGVIDIRHELNDYLYNYGGHIGYTILPSERRKGYAYKQLKLGLDFCKSIGLKRVLITCLDYNIGSSKTIEKIGGILENIVEEKQKGETLKRYWISLKKRYATNPNDMKIVREGSLKIKKFNNADFKGDIALIEFNKMYEPYVIEGTNSYMANDNYKWLEFYDYDKKYRLTAMYNEKEEIVEWYFDIARIISKDKEGPYEDDLYLDIVVTPSGDIILLDEDELKAAFKRKEMTKEEYDEAYKIANDLVEKLKNNKDKLQEYTDKYLREMLN